MEKNKILSIYTLLDPRYKKLHFQSPIAAANAISEIQFLYNQVKVKNKIDVQPAKKNTGKEESIWDVYDELSSIEVIEDHSSPFAMNDEIKSYLKSNLIPRDENLIDCG